ncbi:spermidine acetyltransferase [Salimicrobium jeotgali]|uniref:Spermidine N1-acetyltransferase n=1 Tax=Salimicrobium jeotgali TaxID=1230341 RepID=K2H8J3_9BACI|nr:GNAT family N-acetyltransferase [Salimicrobium jeotgali]AKG03496.1 spermidine acetyltransferase [Salimicrobium jeotgali]EKE31980.1 spermidine N1-acetyltransferase [Salimicrobium jeotgali]MBM7695946.1 diamine N-acetyltransferase [Salimicrobium jeotgali]
MEDHIWLRPLEKDDVPFMHKLYNKKEIMDFWFTEAHFPKDRITTGFEERKEPGKHRLFVICKDEMSIGLTGLYDIEPVHRNTEFGIMIDPVHQGNGHAGEVTKMMVDYAFRTLNLHKIHLIVATENEKAVHIYKKIGFEIEGEMKEHYFINGEYRDAYMMAILKHSYENRVSE